MVWTPRAVFGCRSAACLGPIPASSLTEHAVGMLPVTVVRGYGERDEANPTRADRRRRVGVREVARVAGVSTQTVSRVINDHPGIRTETRERVLDAMRALDYRVNNAARALGTSRPARSASSCPTRACTGRRSASSRSRRPRAPPDAGSPPPTRMPADEASVVDAARHLSAQGVDGIVVARAARAHPDRTRVGGLGLPVTALHSTTRTPCSGMPPPSPSRHLAELGHTRHRPTRRSRRLARGRRARRGVRRSARRARSGFGRGVARGLERGIRIRRPPARSHAPCATQRRADRRVRRERPDGARPDRRPRRCRSRGAGRGQRRGRGRQPGCRVLPSRADHGAPRHRGRGGPLHRRGAGARGAGAPADPVLIHRASSAAR